MDRRRISFTTLLVGAAILLAGCGEEAAEPSVAAPGAPRAFTAEVWADNWFALSVNGRRVGEDPVPITTERSFNATTLRFRATYPLTFAVVAKDFKQDDTGLEYVGTPEQQMGDGGIVMQVTDESSGRVVAGTGTAWRSLVVHRAPLDGACERSRDPATDCEHRITPEPAGWTRAGFDDSRWRPATAFTPAQVGTRGGYGEVRWSPRASLIWSPDLERDNTVLLRSRVRR